MQAKKKQTKVSPKRGKDGRFVSQSSKKPTAKKKKTTKKTEEGVEEICYCIDINTTAEEPDNCNTECPNDCDADCCENCECAEDCDEKSAKDFLDEVSDQYPHRLEISNRVYYSVPSIKKLAKELKEAKEKVGEKDELLADVYDSLKKISANIDECAKTHVSLLKKLRYWKNATWLLSGTTIGFFGVTLYKFLAH